MRRLSVSLGVIAGPRLSTKYTTNLNLPCHPEFCFTASLIPEFLLQPIHCIADHILTVIDKHFNKMLIHDHLQMTAVPQFRCL